MGRHYKYRPKSSEAKARAHPCPTEGCGELVSDGHVVCTDCWCAIPRRFRADLADLFRLRTTDPDQYEYACESTRTLANVYRRRAAA